MLNDNNFFSGGAGTGFYPKEIEQSLRFNDDDSAYLSWTPASAGNRKTWTWSGWVKRGNLGTDQRIFGAGTNGDNQFTLSFQDTDQIIWNHEVSNTRYLINTNAVFRDVSAWYHIVLKVDTTQATSSDRVKLYVNGELQAVSTVLNGYPPQNVDTYVNATNTHNIGSDTWSTSAEIDGYLADVHFTDGTAYDATAFGEFKNGVWVAKEFAGTYGTNGFYLPFRNDYTVEGFSTVTYEGTSSYQYIGGVGFSPDLVWFKSRDGARAHVLVDSVRGVKEALSSGSTDAEYTESANNGVMAFNTDGFTIGNDGGYTSYNSNGESTVAWCWDAGTGSPVSNTDGSITSTVKANPDRGFSVVSATCPASGNFTVGHGLSQAPEMVIVKDRDSSFYWPVYHASTMTSVRNYLRLEATNAQGTSGGDMWGSALPTSTVVGLSTGNVAAANSDFIAYCFHSVSGYSKCGSYSGTGASGNTVTTGFKPAFVMVKDTDGANSWCMYDNVRDPSGDADLLLQAQDSAAEASYGAVAFTDTGFSINSTVNALNQSGHNYIYMAFADTREAAFWLDDSGNNNDWENNGLTESDISLDSPTNNFATLNPIDPYSDTLSEGNLKVVTAANNGGGTAAQNMSTIAIPSSGKWYCEDLMVATGNHGFVGVAYGRGQLDGWYGYYGTNGYRYPADTAYGATFTTGDIIGIAVDVDASTITYYKNNASQGSQTLDTSSGDWRFWFSDGDNTASVTQVVNFGQDSSFAGNKVPQGYTDANGYGDFYYAPPTGYLALCTANLPEPAIGPNSASTSDEHFNTVLYTGDGTSSHAITGVGFQPDFNWIKSRSVGYSHSLHNVLSGAEYVLYTNATNSEVYNPAHISSFDSDGFTTGDNPLTNESGDSYVAWNWKANGSGVTNTDGSITSTVSANVDAGFSIVGYTGTGGNATVGHGLSSAPEMIIIKNRDVFDSWYVWHESLTATEGMLLNTTNAKYTSRTWWNSTLPTSSVYSVVGGTGYNGSGNDIIAYCFHSVEGFSKFGSYTGNGSADGPFVYTGFRPSWIMWKRTDAANGWYITDSTRTTYNPQGDLLVPNTSNAESADIVQMDFLSNGFKVVDTNTRINASGGSYIYMCFSESPFKYSNAR